MVPDEADPRGLRVAHRLDRCIPDEKHSDCWKQADPMARFVQGAWTGGTVPDPFRAARSRVQASSERATLVRGRSSMWADVFPWCHSHWGCDNRNIRHSCQDWFRDFRPD